MKQCIRTVYHITAYINVELHGPADINFTASNVDNNSFPDYSSIAHSLIRSLTIFCMIIEYRHIPIPFPCRFMLRSEEQVFGGEGEFRVQLAFRCQFCSSIKGVQDFCQIGKLLMPSRNASELNIWMLKYQYWIGHFFSLSFYFSLNSPHKHIQGRNEYTIKSHYKNYTHSLLPNLTFNPAYCTFIERHGKIKM